MALEDEQGIYRLDDAPGKPHPHCYCFLTAVVPTLEELEAALANGDFDTADNKFSEDPNFNARLRSESSRPTWRPTMTREEADLWAKDSAIPDLLYHGTGESAANSIRKDGFDLGRMKYGRLHGDGVYLTANKSTLAMYAHGAELMARANVKSPVELMDVWTDTRFGDILEGRQSRYFGTAAAYDRATAESISQFMKESGFDSLIKRANDGSIEELVVLDPKNLVVIEE